MKLRNRSQIIKVFKNMEMKNLKAELKRIAQIWNSSGEYDDTEFEGRFFISDTHLGEFADENGFVSDDAKNELEDACDCQIIYDYEGANSNRQFGDSEVIFNQN